MVVLGIDAHKRNHTVVAVDELGRKLGEHTTGTTTVDHLQLVVWAERFRRRPAVGSRRLPAPVAPAGTRPAGRR